MRLKIVPAPKTGRHPFTVDREFLIKDLAEEEQAMVRGMKVGDSIMLTDWRGNEFCVLALGEAKKA